MCFQFRSHIISVSLCLSVPVCLSVYLSICLSVYLSLPVSLPVFLLSTQTSSHSICAGYPKSFTPICRSAADDEHVVSPCRATDIRQKSSFGPFRLFRRFSPSNLVVRPPMSSFNSFRRTGWSLGQHAEQGPVERRFTSYKLHHRFKEGRNFTRRF